MKGDLFSSFQRDGLPKIESSTFTIALDPGDELHPDPKQCLELGAMILLNKPILVIAMKGRAVSPGLRRIAHLGIEDVDLDTEEGKAKMDAALTEMAALSEEHA